jgi:hypothetical protein
MDESQMTKNHENDEFTKVNMAFVYVNAYRTENGTWTD